MAKHLKKVAFISDIHLDILSQKSLENELEEVFIGYFRENKDIDIIIIGGDLYDRKIQFSSSAAQFSVYMINTLLKITTADIIIIEGTYTHDFMQIALFGSFGPRVHVITTKSIIRVRDMNILCIPEESVMDKQTYYGEELFGWPQKKYDLIVGHGMFDFVGFIPPNTGKGTPTFSTDDVKKLAPITFFGHIHTKMSKGNVHYNGSFSRGEFGQEEAKGFHIITYKDKKNVHIEFIENTLAPQYNTLKYSKIEKDLHSTVMKALKKCDKLRILVDKEVPETASKELRVLHNNQRIYVVQKWVKPAKHGNVTITPIKDRISKDKKIRQELQQDIANYESNDLFSITTDRMKARGIDTTVKQLKELVKE